MSLVALTLPLLLLSPSGMGRSFFPSASLSSYSPSSSFPSLFTGTPSSRSRHVAFPSSLSPSARRGGGDGGDGGGGVWSRFESDLSRPDPRHRREYSYYVLGLTPDASDLDVKQSFRRLVLMHHPDRRGGNVTKFMEIRDALMHIETERLLQSNLTGLDNDNVRDMWKPAWTNQLARLKMRGQARTYSSNAGAQGQMPRSKQAAGIVGSKQENMLRQDENEKYDDRNLLDRIQRLRWKAKLNRLKQKDFEAVHQQQLQIKRLRPPSPGDDGGGDATPVDSAD